MLTLSFLAIDGWSQQGQLIEDLRFVSEFGSKGSAAGQFFNPFGIAVDPEDRLVVADTWNHRIKVCTLDGLCSTFGAQGAEIGQFKYLLGLTLTGLGTIVVSDSRNDRVQLCDYDGNCEILKDEEGNDRIFSNPRDIAVLSDSSLVVTEPDRSSFHVCKHNAACDSFDDIDGESNLFVRPETVAVDSADNIYFMTSFDEIWRCDRLGECDELFGTRGTDSGQFDDPVDLIVEAEGRLIIADRSNQRIQICSMDGDCSAHQVRRTTKQLFYWPAGVALDSSNRVIVSEVEGDKIHIYDPVTHVGPLLPISATMSDAWYDPTTAGQGYFIHVYDQSQIVFVTWFTFDIERPSSGQVPHLGGAGQRWFTAQGNYDKFQARLTLYNSIKGVFLSELDPPETLPVGSMDLYFRDCRTVEIPISIPSENIDERIEVEQLTSDRIEQCEKQQLEP